MSSISFKATARTIDHLGKGQIADAPTAISELWKNSYDAYARDVALHLFDGDIKCGVIIDNGCGMTFEQLGDSWLTIGTASKSKKKLLPEEDRFGLSDRSTQGEKGIGRLSTAFLAPVTLLVTKKKNTKFSAALIDWRLFENTYLGLHDIKVPLEQFDDLEELPSACAKLQKTMLNNLALNPSNNDEEFIRGAWERFSQDEYDAFEVHKKSNIQESFISTESQIHGLCESFQFNQAYIDSWRPILEKVEVLDGEPHGTALFLLDVNRDLELLTNRGDMNRESDEYQAVKKDLVDTLRAFVDPFNRDEGDENIDFRYEIIVFDRNGCLSGNRYDILDYNDVFKYSDFESLEHKVIGHIDDKGWFRGSVTAFGIDYPEVNIPCRIPGMSSLTQPGAFDIKLGTFEFEEAKSTHSETEYDFFKEQADKYAGFMIFRDGLRVLPYGRVDNDFFEIEEKRAKNAGSAYWSARRLFGQISLKQEENYRLKDKAGREGFIINQAARELKSIVKVLLQTLADKYFGRNSDIRQEKMKIWDEEKKKKKKAQKSSARAMKKQFIETIGNNLPTLIEEVEKARNLEDKLASENDISINYLDELVEDISKLEAIKSQFKTPNKPSKLDDSLEDQYRLYRDLFAELNELLVTCREKLNSLEAQIQNLSPIESAEKKFSKVKSSLNALLNRYGNSIDKTLERLGEQWQTQTKTDRLAFEERALPVLDAVTDDSNTVHVLNNFDVIYREMENDFIYKYESFLQALNKLEQGLDLDSAFAIAEEERAMAEEEISQIRSLAQLGISFEILQHELHAQDKAVTRSLNSMSTEAKQEIGFKNAMRSHKQFTEYLRFLSPLKISGYQNRDVISGEDIVKDIRTFFRDLFVQQNINLEFSDKFKRMKIVDVKSRIIPVFVNLLNNAMYWVGLSVTERHIKIDVINDLVIIANNGPAVDQDDIDNLFQLFYSRRPSGNGVGLYLSKQNLSVAHHKIWYAEKPEERLFKDGANFVIQFRGMEVK
ncbi:ATP-binding protein [Hydrogenovibrio sp. JE_KL2]|uniref:ATP-binding protein n=1 Tax=Hydrogenovibrio sp. JE_KL2 TaxID=2651188 RepID=UPI00128B0458|nr:ATP-binding protein [Hydrogenovibrio sp. JE_KL2]MPQ76835.1 histidine kinase [Hydrogenovibrio sp. JE_KL2]